MGAGDDEIRDVKICASSSLRCRQNPYRCTATSAVHTADSSFTTLVLGDVGFRFRSEEVAVDGALKA